jgi:hypothetical protein
MQQTWNQVLINAPVVGGGPSNTVAETSVLPPVAKFTIPANFFYVGAMLRVTLCGQLSNVVTSPGTFDFKFKFGSTAVFDTGALPCSTTAHTTLPHWLSILMTCRVAGTSANFMGQGYVQGIMCLTSGADITTHGTMMAPTTAPAVGANFDSTATQQIDLSLTTSVSTAGTNYTAQQFVVESLN